MCAQTKKNLNGIHLSILLAIFELRKLMMIIIIISASKAILKFTVFYAFAPELRQMVLRLYDQLFLSFRSSIYENILPFFMPLQKYLKLTLWYALTANFPLSIIRISFLCTNSFQSWTIWSSIFGFVLTKNEIRF